MREKIKIVETHYNTPLLVLFCLFFLSCAGFSEEFERESKVAGFHYNINYHLSFFKLIKIAEAEILIEKGIYRGIIPSYRIVFQIDSLDRKNSIIKKFYMMHNRMESFIRKTDFSSLRLKKTINQRIRRFGGIREKNYYEVVDFPLSQAEPIIIDKYDNKLGKREKIDLQALGLEPVSDILGILAKGYFDKERKADSIKLYAKHEIREVKLLLKREKIDSKLLGRVDTIRVSCSAKFPTMGGREGNFIIWFLEEDGQIPVQLQLELPIGSAKISLSRVKYGGEKESRHKGKIDDNKKY
ncbi:DUF3108 domain-containing protein [bacterium]|nr:DUF3108 domain-containing protein [bacterium]